jgi:hypothetical protein
VKAVDTLATLKAVSFKKIETIVLTKSIAAYKSDAKKDLELVSVAIWAFVRSMKHHLE